MDTKKIVTYWKTTADEDWKIANSLFKLKYNSACLFYCHLTLEKLLKGLIVLHTKTHAPYTHNLVRLAEHARLELTKQQREQLQTITQFNIAGRYDDQKYKFHKIATKAYTKKYFDLVKTYYLWVKREYQKK